MALETATYIDALVVSNPDGADARSTADDHLRLIKAALRRSFPMVGGAVSASAVALSKTNDLSASAQAQLNALRDGSHTAKVALVATTCISASSAAALGGVAAGSYARLDVDNLFGTGPSTKNTQTFTGSYALHRFRAEAATAGVRGWVVNYATSASTRGRLIPVALAGDSYTYQSAVIDVYRTASWVELLTLNVGASGKTGALTAVVNGFSYDLINPIQLNSVAASAYARLDAAQTFSKGTGSTPVAVTYSTSITLNCESGNFHRVTLTGNTTLNTPANARPGQTLVIVITQGGSGSYTVTWSSAFRFAGGGTPPTLSTAVGSRDVFAFIYDDTAGHWLQAGLDVKR